MDSDNHLIEIKINSYDELVNLICGKDEKNKHDLREDYVFRGLSNIEYELIPSSLRKNNLNQLNINEFIESDYKFKVPIEETEIKTNNLTYNPKHKSYDNTFIILFDKYGKPFLDKNSDYSAPKNKLQIEKELYILIKFLDYADKSGLKVNAKGFSRYLLHHKSNEPYDEYVDSDVLEIISLAQHYGLPTKALDWSYDYKVSLYFAVKDILVNSKSNDGVLWALNYKLIENQELNDPNYYVNLQIYRPEYNTNPNLNAQKGLFTYLERYVENYDEPLDKIISYELNQDLKDRPISSYYDSKITTIPTNITKNNNIFYKFIIPKEIKHEILKELYLDGYSEEYIFPGYDGVTKSVINRIKLNNLNNPITLKKNIILSVDWDINKVKSKEKLYEFINQDFEFEINKIFIYQNDEIIGYFRGNEIIKDSPKNLWDKFGRYSGLSKDKFDKLFNNSNCFAIRINDFNIFNYSIKLCNFKFEHKFYYIEDNDDLKFLLNFN